MEKVVLGNRYFTVLGNLYKGTGKLLDAGSTGVNPEWRKTIEDKGFKYRAIDIRKSPNAILGDICAMTFEDRSFEAVICSDVLEHIEDWKKAISEIYRVLKPNGLLYLHLPIYYGLKKTKGIEPDKFGHIWLFNHQDIEQEIKRVGLGIRRILYKYDSGDMLLIGLKGVI